MGFRLVIRIELRQLLTPLDHRAHHRLGPGTLLLDLRTRRPVGPDQHLTADPGPDIRDPRRFIRLVRHRTQRRHLLAELVEVHLLVQVAYRPGPGFFLPLDGDHLLEFRIAGPGRVRLTGQPCREEQHHRVRLADRPDRPPGRRDQLHIHRDAVRPDPDRLDIHKDHGLGPVQPWAQQAPRHADRPGDERAEQYDQPMTLQRPADLP